MNKQINLRLSREFIETAEKQAKQKGFSTIQEFIKEILRENLFDEEKISKKELEIIKRLIKVNEEKALYGDEKELFGKLNN